jgi:phage replication O-like protein O
MLDGKAIQVEDGGYTRIHNAILETLATARLSPLEFRLVLFVLRKTYGFQKKTDVISISQFETCGGSRPATVEAIQNLLRLKVLIRQGKRNGYEYGFNKYVETWLPEVFETRRPHQADNFHGQNSKPDGTSKVDGTSKPDGTSTSKPDGTKTSKPDGTHKRKKESIKETPTHQVMFGSLARICKVDPKMKAGQIARTMKTLIQAGYTPLDLDCFEKWWNEKDFRGRRGDPPTLAQVVDKILQSKQETPPAPAAPYTGGIVLPNYLTEGA